MNDDDDDDDDDALDQNPLYPPPPSTPTINVEKSFPDQEQFERATALPLNTPWHQS